MKNITPVGYKVLVKPLPSKEEFIGGIIASTVTSELAEGEVIAFADEYKNIYSVGDTVLYYKNRGVSIVYNGEPHEILDGFNGVAQGDIICIINE